MGEHDNFQDRLRAIADQFSRSVERLSEMDLEQLAERYGVDVERARLFADAAEHWLSDRLTGNEPLFGDSRPPHAEPAPHAEPMPGTDPGPPPEPAPRSAADPASAGPHPLDLPSDRQGLALAALDSGRWTVRPGSNRLTKAGAADGPPPPRDAPDLVGDLRARDWITADGTLTLVGRQALARWCRTATESAAAPPPGLTDTE